MDKWLRELLLLSVGALLAFGLFAVLHFAADRADQRVRWEAYAAASLIGAVFGFAAVRAVSSPADKVAALERRVAALEGGRSDHGRAGPAAAPASTRDTGSGTA